MVHNRPAGPPLNGSKKLNGGLEWPVPSPDWNPVEMLQPDLSLVVCAQKPSSVAELWTRTPPEMRKTIESTEGPTEATWL